MPLSQELREANVKLKKLSKDFLDQLVLLRNSVSGKKKKAAAEAAAAAEQSNASKKKKTSSHCVLLEVPKSGITNEVAQKLVPANCRIAMSELHKSWRAW